MAAFAGGFLLKGKSGWCSSLCPMLPVQRMYGQTPFANVPNSHCRPCLGCTKNCFDFNPKVAFLADVHDGDRQWSTTRKLFTAAFPGLVIAFFTEQETAVVALAAAASAGSFLAARGARAGHDTQARRPLRRRRDQPLLLVGRARPGLGRLAAASGGARAHRRVAAADVRQGARVPGAPGPAGAAAGGGAARARRAAALRAAAEAEVTFEEGGPRDHGQAGHAAARARRERRAADRGRAAGWASAAPTRCACSPAWRTSPPSAATRRRRSSGSGSTRRTTAWPAARASKAPVTVSMTPAARLQRRRLDRLPVRPRRRARGRARQRHRGRHRRRPRAPPPPGLRDRRRRRRAAPALQPHGHLAAHLRAVGDGRPAPAARRLVRRQPHHLLAQHARAPDRPRRRRGACSAPASGCRSIA